MCVCFGEIVCGDVCCSFHHGKTRQTFIPATQRYNSLQMSFQKSLSCGPCPRDRPGSERCASEAAIKPTFLSIGIVDHKGFTQSEVTDIKAIKHFSLLLLPSLQLCCRLFSPGKNCQYLTYLSSLWLLGFTVKIRTRLMYQVEMSWEVSYFGCWAALGFAGGFSVGGGRWGGRKKKYCILSAMCMKYNQATPVCRQLCITLVAFWHVGGRHGNYRKRGRSQYFSDAMRVFLSTLPGCEINTEINFSQPAAH